MQYRPHRRLLDESMAEVVNLRDRKALVDHLASELSGWGYYLTEDDLRIEPYGYDDRIKWNTHIVTLRNKELSKDMWYFGKDMGPDYFGAIGFTDSAQ